MCATALWVVGRVAQVLLDLGESMIYSREDRFIDPNPNLSGTRAVEQVLLREDTDPAFAE